MYDKAILGLLRLAPMTAYDIAEAMKRSTSFFYSASQGSIHPALQKLLKAGAVSVDEVVEGGRHKKRYTITAAGKTQLRDWLKSPLVVGKVKDEALLRLFFLGALPASQRASVIDGYRASLTEQLAALDALWHQAEQRLAEVPKARQQDAAYQMHTLRLGRDYYRFMLDWFGKL